VFRVPLTAPLSKDNLRYTFIPYIPCWNLIALKEGDPTWDSGIIVSLLESGLISYESECMHKLPVMSDVGFLVSENGLRYQNVDLLISFCEFRPYRHELSLIASILI
jgi:hypothetical protein